MLMGLWLNLIRYTPLKLELPLLSARTLLCRWVVIKSAQGFSGIAGWFLASLLVVYLGKISYGLYLNHKPTPHLLRRLGVAADVMPPVAMFLMYTALSIIVVALS